MRPVPPVLEVREVCRDFGGVRAVDGVTFSVFPGKITGLIGPNGAGKTTIINLISGLLAVTRGSVFCRDREITRATATAIARQGIARTFQTSRLFEDMTVEENVLVAARFGRRGTFRREKESGKAVYQLLRRFDLEPFSRVPASDLSYGHRRRLELARAVALDPLVILLDEPVAGMHDAEAAEIAGIVKDLSNDGIGVLVVEHNIGFVASLADHLLVVDQGRVIAEGPTSQTLEDPAVVAAYLGTSHA